MPGENDDQGGDGTDGGKPNIPPPPTKPATNDDGDGDGTVTLTQKQLDNMDRKFQRKAQQAAEKELSDKFGGLSVDEVTALVTAQQEAQEAEKSDAQKATETAEAATAEARAATAIANRKAFELDMRAALLTPGEDPATEPAVRMNRVDAALDLALRAADRSDLEGPEAIAAAITSVRSTLPELFSESSDGAAAKPPATPGTPGRTGKERSNAEQVDDPGKAMLDHVNERQRRIGTGDLPILGRRS